MTSEEREVNKQVAELMGLRLFEDRKKFYCVPQVDGNHDWYNAFSGPWNPCGRPEHWWRVVERVREQDDRNLENRFMILLEQLSIPSIFSSFWWFLLEGNPGVAICKAFVEAMADG